MSTVETEVGHVVSLHRFPVKSMQGEELNAMWLSAQGFLGDRAFGLIDEQDGRVVSAKNPRKWPTMFDFRANYLTPPHPDSPLPPLRITLPDGTTVSNEQADVHARLSEALGRTVRLEQSIPERAQLEEYWPGVEGLDHQDTVTVEAIKVGSFFDGAAVHLLTTATLDALRSAHPAGRYEARRFRPNVMIRSRPGEAGFPEIGWIQCVVAIGPQARVRITGPCPRCVMTTLDQADLPRDVGILRTAVEQNRGHVGVYAEVVQEGWVRRHDRVCLLASDGGGAVP